VTTVAAGDADGDTLTYSIVGGRMPPPSPSMPQPVPSPSRPRRLREPTDVGHNNVYDVTVQVSDGVHNTNQGVAIGIAGRDVVTAGQCSGHPCGAGEVTALRDVADSAMPCWLVSTSETGR